MKYEYSVIIVDRNQADRRELEEYSNQLNLKIISSIGSAKWFLEDCLKMKPDLVMLNTKLQDGDGFTAYSNLKDRGISPYCIMFSEQFLYSELITCFKMNCVDFLRKPIKYSRIEKAISNAKELINQSRGIHPENSGNIICIRSNYRTIYINENNIIYAQKQKGLHKSLIFLEGNKIIETTSSITEILNQCSNTIYTPNQSSLVNIKFIKSVLPSVISQGNYVISLIDSTVTIDLSRRKKADFKALVGNAFGEIY